MKRVLKWWLLILIVLLLAGAGGFVIWGSTPLGPMPEALAALEPGPEVTVTTDRWITFEPGEAATTGLILYPGGRVDPRAYAPTARAIAEEGVLVVIVPMPLNLAVLAPNRAQAVIDVHSEIETWAVGGHSLGGAMAARFVYAHPATVDGLVLWASYPAESNDLSARDVAVVSIYGSRDGLATPEKVSASRDLLPPETRWIEIAGGNYAQFGWYGPQDGDLSATISRSAQQAEIVQATTALLERMAARD
ncbi:MAG: alpha/beta hydrolase [Anaerolineae bacterium]